MAPASKHVKKIGITAAVVTGVSMGSYMTVYSMLTNDVSSVSQETETNKKQIISKNEKKVNKKETIKDIAINLEVVNEEDEYRDLVERAVQPIADYSNLFAYEDNEDSPAEYEYAFNNIDTSTPKVNNDGQFAFNEDQMNPPNEDGHLVASLDPIVNEEVLPDNAGLTSEPRVKKSGVPVNSVPVYVHTEVLVDPRREIEQSEVLADSKPEPEKLEVLVDSQSEPEQSEVIVSPQSEPEKLEVIVNPQPATKQPEVPVNPQPEPEQLEVLMNPQPEPEQSEVPVNPQPEPEQSEMPANPQPEPEQSEVPVNPQPEPEQSVVPVNPQPEPEQSEVPANPQPEPKQPEVPVNPQPDSEQPEVSAENNVPLA